MPATVFRESGELLAEFFSETEQHIDLADRLLLALEKNPDDKQSVDALYRSFHSIKGLSGFFGLRAMNAIAHRAEDLLGAARDGTLHLTGKAADLAFAALDGIKRQCQFAREASATRGNLRRDPKARNLLTALERFLKDPNDPTIVVPGHTAEQTHRSALARQSSQSQPAPAAPQSTLSVPPAAPIPPKAVGASPPVCPPAVTPTPTPAPTTAAPPTPAVEQAAHQPASPSPTAATPPQPQATAPRAVERSEKESIRVDCDKLDHLINTIGELVISSSMIGQLLAQRDPFSAEAQSFTQLTKVVRDLQEMSLGLRLMPVAATFQKMARIARDVAKKLGKQVQFVTEGEETELDKSVVDHIGDPLMHMVRNAVDHGVERPEVRVAAGKPPQGTVRLRAFHQGGNVYLELSDDGKGLDRAVLLRKAMEKGLVTDGSHMTDAEVFALIFEPGFSTAKEVTDVSGRGVGMDVVRRNVEALQGSVTVRSELGRGSTMTIRLPLTLAILDGLMVRVGDVVYVLPLLAVVESLRPRRHELKRVGARTEVVVVRGETVPLIRLHRLFNTPCHVSDPAESVAVIVEDQGRKCALLVDSLIGQSQVVIKNMEANYRKVDGVAGATILGDGNIALILDVYGLIRLAGEAAVTLPEPDPRSARP